MIGLYKENMVKDSLFERPDRQELLSTVTQIISGRHISRTEFFQIKQRLVNDELLILSLIAAGINMSEFKWDNDKIVAISKYEK